MKISKNIKRDVRGFTLNFCAIVLGIVITFWGQSIVDKNHELDDVKSSLHVVRDEMLANLEDLKACADGMDIECEAAVYLNSNLDGPMDGNKIDTLLTYAQIVTDESHMVLPHDALDLVRSNGIFAKMDNKELPLKIITAYALFDRWSREHDAVQSKAQRLLEELFKTRGLKDFQNEEKQIRLGAVLTTEYGQEIIRTYMLRDGSKLRQSLPQIEETIAAIDEFIGEDCQ